MLAMNTKWKVILSIMLLIATICTVFFSIMLKQQDQKIKAIITGKSESSVLLAETILSSISKRYQKRAIAFSNPDFSDSREQMIRAFAQKDRKELLRLSEPLFSVLKKEDPYFASMGWILPDNRVFLRVQKPEQFGDNIENVRQDIVEVHNTRQQLFGFNAGVNCIQYRIVQPVFYHEKYLGVVQFGIKGSVIFDALHKKLNTIAGMAILNEEYVSQPQVKTPKIKGKTHTILTNDVSIFASMEKEPDWQRPQQRVMLNNRPHVLINVAPVSTFQNKTLGSFFVALDISEQLAQKQKLLVSVLFISAILLSFSFLILYFSYGSLIEKIVTLNKSLEKNNLELEKRVDERTTKLQENEQRLQKILDHAPVGILIANSQTMQLQYANPAICSMLGYDRTELNNMQVTSLHKGEELSHISEVFEKFTAGLEDTAIDIPFLRKDGTLFEADVIGATFELEGNSAIIGFVVDRTEMKKLGKQLQRSQKMEAIGMMAGGVAHDLNNILSGIIGYPELILLQISQSSELREPILAIQEAGKRAATVVADLLTVARGVASTREPHDLHRLVNEYLDSPEFINLKSFHPDILCTTKLDAHSSVISCSPVHIKKIVMNLLTNAFEATEDPGNVSLSTSNQLIENTGLPTHDLLPGKYVILEIQDSGHGIAEEDLEHIFEPFYTKKTMGKSGTGLGLAVVWNTVQDHKGKIFTKSNNKGTLFQIYFPITEGKETDKKKDHPLKYSTSDNGEKLLVIDDEQQLRDIATQMLHILNYKVDSVPSGESALAFLKENSVDLIILDMLMEPGMGGRQTYEEILKINPDQKAIIVSGFSESDDVIATLRLGASKFVKKPYSIETLGRVVHEVLSK